MLFLLAFLDHSALHSICVSLTHCVFLFRFFRSFSFLCLHKYPNDIFLLLPLFFILFSIVLSLSLFAVSLSTCLTISLSLSLSVYLFYHLYFPSFCTQPHLDFLSLSNQYLSLFLSAPLFFFQVVLYHNAKRSSKNFKMALGEDSRTCTPFMTLSSTEPPVTTLVPLETLRDATSFVVLTGSNDNYPDPIRWGLSYHINGEESPILELKRGVQYTFMVEAGDSHPLYLTDDRNGGRSNEAETVYAGSEDAFGTPEAPYVLTFTPTAEHPDLLYYQCWYHQKLGWEVRIVDAPTTTATTVAATAPTAATTATTAATTAAMTTEGSACQTASTESGFDCQSVITGELTVRLRGRTERSEREERREGEREDHRSR